MKKDALTMSAAVLLMLLGLFHIGAGIWEFGKGELLTATTSAVAGLGDGVANSAPPSAFSDGVRSNSRNLRAAGAFISLKLYLVAFFVLATAVLQIAASIGIFGGKPWAFRVVVASAICGILVEFHDIAEDGLGAGQVIFLFVYALVLYTAFSARDEAVATKTPHATSGVTDCPFPSSALYVAEAVRTSVSRSPLLGGAQPVPAPWIIAECECSNCGTSVGVEDEFCGECGNLLTRSIAARGCSNCGTAVGAEDQFCGECGNPLVSV